MIWTRNRLNYSVHNSNYTFLNVFDERFPFFNFIPTIDYKNLFSNYSRQLVNTTVKPFCCKKSPESIVLVSVVNVTNLLDSCFGIGPTRQNRGVVFPFSASTCSLFWCSMLKNWWWMYYFHCLRSHLISAFSCKFANFTMICGL